MCIRECPRDEPAIAQGRLRELGKKFLGILRRVTV